MQELEFEGIKNKVKIEIEKYKKVTIYVNNYLNTTMIPEIKAKLNISVNEKYREIFYEYKPDIYLKENELDKIDQFFKEEDEYIVKKVQELLEIIKELDKKNYIVNIEGNDC